MATFPYTSAVVGSDGTTLVLRFNLSGLTEPVGEIVQGAASLTVESPVSTGITHTFVEIVNSGAGPFYAYYTLNTAVEAGDSILVSAPVNLFKDASGTQTAAFSDFNVTNSVSDNTTTAPTKLASVAEVKTFLGISGSTDDTLLGTLLDAVTAAFVRVTGRKIFKTLHVEMLDGNDTESILLDHTPVITINSIRHLDSDGSTELIESCDYRVDKSTGEVRLLDPHRGVNRIRTDSDMGVEYGVVPYFREGFQNYIVEYEAGYASADLPADIKQTAIQIASDMYQSRRINGALQSETLGDYTYTVRAAEEQWKNHRMMMNQFKRMTL